MYPLSFPNGIISDTFVVFSNYCIRLHCSPESGGGRCPFGGDSGSFSDEDDMRFSDFDSESVGGDEAEGEDD